jgi:hypothetical protein
MLDFSSQYSPSLSLSRFILRRSEHEHAQKQSSKYIHISGGPIGAALGPRRPSPRYTRGDGDTRANHGTSKQAPTIAQDHMNKHQEENTQKHRDGEWTRTNRHTTRGYMGMGVQGVWLREVRGHTSRQHGTKTVGYLNNEYDYGLVRTRTARTMGLSTVGDKGAVSGWALWRGRHAATCYMMVHFLPSGPPRPPPTPSSNPCPCPCPYPWWW